MTKYVTDRVYARNASELPKMVDYAIDQGYDIIERSDDRAIVRRTERLRGDNPFIHVVLLLVLPILGNLAYALIARTDQVTTIRIAIDAERADELTATTATRWFWEEPTFAR